MPYADFTLDALIRQFKLQVREREDLFAGHAPVAISDLLRQHLATYLSLALDMGTEKARSEFIIAPILGEVRQQCRQRISLFSGVEFNVDADHGLRGVCDFLLSLSPLQLTLQAPVVAIVAAKNENIRAGFGQCLAEMLAAQRFNQERDNTIPIVYGVVTTGSNWRFLSLREAAVAIDGTEYLINEVERIVGVLVGMIRTAMGEEWEDNPG